ncbi:MAG: hypothetical protein HeimC3_52560 [Candidatus Heimdallarchaeota archaeon LC_3]|nr:MAG: hypothetical protein HeimC3_52560 [Candidatus Heimdallarchaeota archaeon LC_3]
MALLVEDMEEKNWIICESCKNLCKNPNYDYDLKRDECCLCVQTDARCSSCSNRKLIEYKKRTKKELMYF